MRVLIPLSAQDGYVAVEVKFCVLRGLYEHSGVLCDLAGKGCMIGCETR